MITVFNRELLLTTFDMDEYLNVRDKLVSGNIDYKLVIRNRRDYGSMLMRKGTIYTGRRFSCEYNPYVHTNDYDNAIAAIHKKDDL